MTEKRSYSSNAFSENAFSDESYLRVLFCAPKSAREWERGSQGEGNRVLSSLRFLLPPEPAQTPPLLTRTD
jgi:hypothetical protein